MIHVSVLLVLPLFRRSDAAYVLTIGLLILGIVLFRITVAIIHAVGLRIQVGRREARRRP